MPWLPSFLKSKPKTSYKYETQADLNKLTAEEIIQLDPKELDGSVGNDNGVVKLTGDKRESMLRLLVIKDAEERNPKLIPLRPGLVANFLRKKSEAEKLMRDTQAEIDAEAAEQNTTRNRLTLLDNPQVPTKRPYSKKGGRKSLNTRRRRASRAKRAIKRSYKMSHKRMQRTRRR